MTVVSLQNGKKVFIQMNKGEVTISTPWIGTYLLETSFEDNSKGEVDGKSFDKTIHTITYTIKCRTRFTLGN